jgi:hypothetical protein
VDDDARLRAAGHFAPALRERAALIERQRTAFARAAADEERRDAIVRQEARLSFDDREIQRAIGVKRRVSGGNEAVEWMGGFHNWGRAP